MTDLAVTVEAVGNLALVAVMAALAIPRTIRAGMPDVAALSAVAGLWAATNVGYAAFYLERRRPGIVPDWIAYDTGLEHVVKGLQIGTMYALPSLVIVTLYRFHRPRYD